MADVGATAPGNFSLKARLPCKGKFFKFAVNVKRIGDDANDDFFSTQSLRMFGGAQASEHTSVEAFDTALNTRGGTAGSSDGGLAFVGDATSPDTMRLQGLWMTR